MGMVTHIFAWLWLWPMPSCNLALGLALDLGLRLGQGYTTLLTTLRYTTIHLQSTLHCTTDTGLGLGLGPTGSRVGPNPTQVPYNVKVHLPLQLESRLE